jgi:phenylalanyl-tRNA synthetase beta chain
MKFSEQWLRTWINPTVNTQQLAQQFTDLGLEVNAITPVAGSFTGVIVGKVRQVNAHPASERLSVCVVDIGNNHLLTIVCGASNVRAGLNVAVAQIGAILPENKIISVANLRGVSSEGMLCSSKELGLTEENTGEILELADPTILGQDLVDYLQLKDQSFDLQISPNRGDCLSIVGLARELSAVYLNPITYPKQKTILPLSQKQIPIRIDDPKDCPIYHGRIIHDLNPQVKTPTWMSERLRRSGLRTSHPVVDITNYVLIELGQPLHAFDFDQIQSALTIRRARTDEQITLLDGKTVQLNPETLIVADHHKPLAIAGIMGGLDAAITTQTRSIFLESAFFNPQCIRGRARHYGIDSQAAYRFERGVDPNKNHAALERATQLILDIVGGTPGPIISIKDLDYFAQTQPILLRITEIERHLGVQIEPARIMQILQALGMQLISHDLGWFVTAPSWRFDLNVEVDLIEEIARVWGYQNIPTQLPTFSVAPPTSTALSLNRLRDTLVDRGYYEAITYSFISQKLQKQFEPEADCLVLENPISQEFSVMRTSLWPGLITSIAYNQKRQQSYLRFFETGLRFLTNAHHEIQQQSMLAGVITGNIYPEQWGFNQPCDFYTLKSDLEALLQRTGQSSSFVPAQHPALHPGQSALIYLADKAIGYCGALHPKLITDLELQGPIYLFELQLDALLSTSIPQWHPFSKYPHVRRDISFWIDQTISFQKIAQQIKESAGPQLQDLRLFDVYLKKENPKEMDHFQSNQRSLALGLVWQHPERTLLDTEIEVLFNQVIDDLKSNFHITLREG